MDPEQFDEDDINHMRKVVGYVNRHLAQEDHLKETKTKEELENAKSTISLKNWGHNPAKTTNKDADVEEKDATTPENATAEGEDQIQDIKQGSATETANSDTANRKGTKRRLDQDDEEQFKTDNVQDSTEDDAVDDSEDEAVNDEEDRPRKKSKTVRVA
ncbi:hypothetical protein A0H81_11560 [Grifola frondosa]|uniref:Uncharacterized protein n=1 Tax=Grifola frondosa TaxID=5627 RepID=A0A1C7LVC0_GRIFR|nr:hypothetical protein A0H81_11560 [Grifola frondosa]